MTRISSPMTRKTLRDFWFHFPWLLDNWERLFKAALRFMTVRPPLEIPAVLCLVLYGWFGLDFTVAIIDIVLNAG